MFRKHIFLEDGRKIFLYIPATNKLLETNKATKTLMQSNTMEELSLKIEQTDMEKDVFISELHKMNLFKDDIISFSESPKKENIENSCSCLVLSIVQKCNLNCRYCFAEGGEYKNSGIMSFETAKKAIDQFQFDGEGEPQYIVFFGGEPLLNFSLIKKVVKYCEEREQEGKRKILFSITTNATLITPEISEFFSKHDIHPHISIDGDADTNDANRFDSLGKGSYKKIVAGLNKIDNKKFASARGTLTNAGADVNKAVQHLLNLGFGYVFMAPAFNLLDDDHIKCIIDSYNKLYEHFKVAISEKKYEECRKIQNIYKLLKNINSAQVKTRFCGAGVSEMALDINGDIYPCHRFIGQKDFYMGNIDNFKNEKLYNDFGFSKKQEDKKESMCADCIAQGICGGGCFFENYTLQGDIHSAVPASCAIMKYMTESALKLYITLTLEDKNNLFEKA